MEKIQPIRSEHYLALLVAEAEEGAAHVLVEHEVGVDAVGHVSVPHVKSALTVDIGKLTKLKSVSC